MNVRGAFILDREAELTAIRSYSRLIRISSAPRGRAYRLLCLSVGAGYAETVVDYGILSTWLTFQWVPH